MVVTKYCKPADRDRMLSGHFKIGSHAEYSGGEGTGLLSDTKEGSHLFELAGELINRSGKIGGITFSGITAINCDRGIVSERTINCLMFCVSAGAYSSDTHNALLKGDPSVEYEANPALTEYLEINHFKLKRALRRAGLELFGINAPWIGKPVTYKERVTEIPNHLFTEKFDLNLAFVSADMAFTKPAKYQLENEFRYVLPPQEGVAFPKAIFTKDLSETTQQAFADSIIR